LAAYGVIGYTPVRREELSTVCRLVGWLVEAYHLRIVLKLSHIPHFTTLQKFTERISGTILGKIISSFIIFTNIGQLFVGIDSSGWVQSNSLFTVLCRKSKT
jgi:hypothetical protein